MKKNEFKIDTEEMMRLGVHFGHKTSKINPKMKQFIIGVRNGVHIIDLQKTKDKLEEALNFIQKIILEQKIIVLVGTKISLKDLIKNIALECNLPYITERWLGGTFTNFEIIFKRIQYLRDLEKKEKEGFFEKYSKREKQRFLEELEKIRKKIGGIKNLEKLPDAVFVCDMKKDINAVKEARKKGIKIVAIADTNVDPTLADIVIPASDDGRSAMEYILEKVKEVVLKAESKTQNSNIKSNPKSE